MEEQERTGEQETDLTAEDAEMMARLQEEIRNLPVSDHLVYMMQSLSGLAVGRMGLTADSAARRDMDQARLAIDAFRALLEVLERSLPPGEMAPHRGMLSQLQLAYVGALDARTETAEEGADSSSSQPGEGAEEDAEAPEDADAPEDAQETPKQAG